MATIFVEKQANFKTGHHVEINGVAIPYVLDAETLSAFLEGVNGIMTDVALKVFVKVSEYPSFNIVARFPTWKQFQNSHPHFSAGYVINRSADTQMNTYYLLDLLNEAVHAFSLLGYMFATMPQIRNRKDEMDMSVTFGWTVK